MAFNFPDPAVSTTTTNPVTGAKYQWKADPGKWVLIGGPADAANPPVTISLLPPEGPQKGDLWIHEETLVEYAWDGTQWFEVGSSCGGGNEEDKEEEELYHPFINSFKLVAPDDFNGESGTATIRTSAYDAGDDSYLSPVVKSVAFAVIDLNGRRLELAKDGDIIHLTPENEIVNGTAVLYGELEVTAVTNGASSTNYEVDFDFNRTVIYTEGDIVYYRIASSDLYVRKEGGDEMEGPLVVSGPRKAGDDPDQTEWESTIKVLNVENRAGGYLGLKHNGTTKVYVGETDVTIANDIKFNRGQGTFISSDVQEVLKVNDRDVAYLGQIIEEDSLVTKGYVDEADEALRQDILELEQEIDAIAPSVERGEWTYSNTGIANASGSYSMNTDTFDAGLGDPANIFAAVENIVINEKDNSNTIHSFANAEVGQLIEIFEASDADYGLYEILDVTKQTGGGTGPTPAYTYWSFDVALVSTGQGDTASGVARFKIFSPPSGGTADGFVLKTGDTMTGDLEILRKAENDDKKPFMIQGKYTNGNLYDMFYAYRAADGKDDGVAYYGRQPDSELSAHIATTGFVAKKVNKAIQAAGLQLGSFNYKRNGDPFQTGHIRSNATTNPASITQLEIHKTNDDGIAWGTELYEAVIREKMYVHFLDKGVSNYTGRITNIEIMTNGVKLTLTPVTDLISGSVYLNNKYDLFIGHNKFGFKYPA